MTNGKPTWLRGFVLAALAGFASVALTPQVFGQSSARPQYTAEGQLRLPVGFESWVFVGSNLGMAYDPTLPLTDAREKARAETPQFHNVYINPEAYAHYAATKEFPDPTILVMEVFAAADKGQQPVLSTGQFNGDRVGLEVAVKDTRRPTTQPPVTTPWAYYTFQNPMVPSPMRQAAGPDGPVCQACHKLHASKDNVWVQFYPTLRKLGP